MLGRSLSPFVMNTIADFRADHTLDIEAPVP